MPNEGRIPWNKGKRTPRVTKKQLSNQAWVDANPNKVKAKMDRYRGDILIQFKRSNGVYKKTYGISLFEKEIMWIDQDWNCASCGEYVENPHTDHDHHTGDVRGLLCSNCNMALGLLHDNTNKIIALGVYRERFEHTAKK